MAEAALEVGNIKKNIMTIKKFILHVLVPFLYPFLAYTQSMEDILRYTRTELKGTARYVAKGGAFNALGGDFSAIKDNPAAAAVFELEIGLTLNTTENRIDANYFGDKNLINSGASDMNQLGLVLIINDSEAEILLNLHLPIITSKKVILFPNSMPRELIQSVVWIIIF